MAEASQELSPQPASATRQLAFLWCAVALSLMAVAPLAGYVAGALPGCVFKGLTGVPCPGCGTTRAALALAELDPLGALVRYPLPTLAWTFLIAGGLMAGWRAWRGQPLPRLPKRVPVWARIGLVGVILANWAYSIATGV